MLGVAFHAPSLVSLMVDRERFTTVVVPSAFDADTQDELDTLFATKPRSGTRRLLLVDEVDTLGKIAAHFPEAKIRIIVFDIHDKLTNVTDLVIDVQKTDPTRLVSIRPDALNPALVKLKPTALEDYRHDYKSGDKVEIATRNGILVALLKGASKALQLKTAQCILGLTQLVSVKRAGRQDKPRVAKLKTYIESDASVELLYAFMDIALYGTEDKTAALFADADLEDLRFVVRLVEPDPDLPFSFEVPDKLKLARE